MHSISITKHLENTEAQLKKLLQKFDLAKPFLSCPSAVQLHKLILFIPYCCCSQLVYPKINHSEAIIAAGTAELP
jgi:hypothetical protein